jgi:dihydrolipoamide dehydrogenase
MDVDVLIAGAGGAGYPAAFRLSKAGFSVVMADPKGELGGNCLYQGCVPSKTVRELTQLIKRAKLLNSNIPVDFHLIQDHKDKVQEIRFKQHKSDLSKTNIEFIKGNVELLDKNHAIVRGDKDLEVNAKYIILATGSEPFKPKIPGEELCITSDDLYKYGSSIRELPNEMVIIGGGYIAFEAATMFNILGTKVHVLVRSDKILRGIDSRLSSTLLQLMDKNIDIKFNSPVLEIKKYDRNLQVEFSNNGNKETLYADQVLLATGRVPVYPKGIEKTEVKMDRKGVIVDNSIATSVKNIFAPGDVNGISMFFHSAVRQSLVAAHNIMAGGTTIDYMDFNSVPKTIFTFPPIAYIGLTPDIAKKNGIETIEASYSFADDSRAQMYNEMEGEIRLFFEKSSLRLVGGWIIGIDAPSLINEIGIAMANGLTARQLADYPDQHPMTNEGVSYAARSIF